MEMGKKLSSAAKTLTPSPIQELSHLAQRCNAINLAEGFPDFPAPSHLKKAAVSAILSDFNQYRLVSLLSCIQLLLELSLYPVPALFGCRELEDNKRGKKLKVCDVSSARRDKKGFNK